MRASIFIILFIRFSLFSVDCVLHCVYELWQRWSEAHNNNNSQRRQQTTRQEKKIKQIETEWTQRREGERERENNNNRWLLLEPIKILFKRCLRVASVCVCGSWRHGVFALVWVVWAITFACFCLTKLSVLLTKSWAFSYRQTDTTGIIIVEEIWTWKIIFDIFIRTTHFAIRLYVISTVAVCCSLNPFDTSSCSVITTLTVCVSHSGSNWLLSSAADHETEYVHLAIPNEYESRDAQCALVHTHSHPSTGGEWMNSLWFILNAFELD